MIKVLMIIILLTPSAYSQALYFNEGSTGITLKGDFTTNNVYSGFGGYAGITAGGIFDFGLKVSRSYSPDFESVAYGSAVSVSIRRDGDKGGLTLTGSYIIQHSNILRQSFTFTLPEFTTNGLEGGAAFVMPYYKGNKIRLYVEGGINFIYLFNSFSRMESGTLSRIYFLKLPVAASPDLPGFIITPGITYYQQGIEEVTSFIVSMGVLFSLKK